MSITNNIFEVENNMNVIANSIFNINIISIIISIISIIDIIIS